MTDEADFLGFMPVRLPDAREWTWVGVGDLVVELGAVGSGHFLRIVGGTLTDFMSIPWYLRWLINPANPSTAIPAYVHDALLDLGYQQQCAAGEFLRQLQARGVPLGWRILFYLGVVAAIDRW